MPVVLNNKPAPPKKAPMTLRREIPVPAMIAVAVLVLLALGLIAWRSFGGSSGTLDAESVKTLQARKEAREDR